MRKEFKRTSAALNAPIPMHVVDDTPRPTFGLGLMGGGSWGAFTAGVLEIIVPALERVGTIKAISGTSAGAVNGVLLGSGLNDGGAHTAIRRVNTAWEKIKSHGHILQMTHQLTDLFLPRQDRWPNLPTQFNMMSGMQQMINPFMPSIATQYISDMVKDLVPDWKSVQDGKVRIAINTILEDFATGEQQHIILDGDNLTPHGVGGSASLRELGCHMIRDTDNPNLTGKRCLDGGYKENPPIGPLQDAGVTDIVMIVLHDHLSNEASPSLGAKLYHEEIHTDVAALVLDDAGRSNIHAIEIEMANGEINGWHLNHSSKLNTSPEFIETLRDAGRMAGLKWLTENIHNLGVESTYRPHASAVATLIASGYNY